MYFVYFYGPTFEFAWARSNTLLSYQGLDGFIKQAETAVQQASSRGEQEALANRYELKVTGQKRIQW
jgi:hypothetical protein